MQLSLQTLSKKFILMGCLLGVLAACSARPGEEISCPEVKVIKDTDHLTRFKPGPGRDITDIILQAKLLQADGGCEVFSDEIFVDLVVGIQASQGAALGAKTEKLDLIIGIVGRDGKLIAKAPVGHRKMPILLDFPANTPVINYQEFVSIVIPRENELQPPRDFRIYVSLGLTPEEFKFNQEN